jgi:hypothetical protein
MQPEDTPKKPYSAPQLNRLSFEQAALVLIGHAWHHGNRDARDLLELMFRRVGEPASRIECNFGEPQVTQVFSDSGSGSGWKGR